MAPPNPVADVDTASASTTNRPAHPPLLREMNERYVLNTIRALRPISRAEVARQTGLSKPTVSLALTTLRTSGLVTAVGTEPGRPGRAGLLFEPVADAVLAVGLEIGVFGVRGALVDLDGTVVAERATPVPERSPAAVIFSAVISTVEALARAVERPTTDIVALVVGTPGVIHPSTGQLSQAGTVPELDGSQPARALAGTLGLSVTVFNDVDLAAVAEQSEGPGREFDDFAVLWIGSGLGAALVLDGRVHLGSRGGAGEVFDIPFADVVEAQGDGAQSGTVGIDASEGGTIALAAALAAQHPTSVLRPPFDALAILDSATFGDPLGVDVRDHLSRWIAWYAATVTAVLDPQLVVLAGPIGAHDALLATVGNELGRLLAAPPRLVSSQLGDRSVLIGAIARAREDAEEIAFVTRSRERTP